MFQIKFKKRASLWVTVLLVLCSDTFGSEEELYTNLPEMIRGSDHVILGKVSQLGSNFYHVKTMKSLKGKFVREFKILQKKDVDSRLKKLAIGDGLLLFLVQVPHKKIYATYGNFVEGEVPVKDHMAHFQKNLFAVYKNKLQTITESDPEEEDPLVSQDSKDTSFVTLKYDNIAKGINLFLQIFKNTMDVGQYNELMVDNESNLSVEEKMVLRYGYFQMQ